MSLTCFNKVRVRPELTFDSVDEAKGFMSKNGIPLGNSSTATTDQKAVMSLRAQLEASAAGENAAIRLIFSG